MASFTIYPAWRFQLPEPAFRAAPTTTCCATTVPPGSTGGYVDKYFFFIYDEQARTSEHFPCKPF